MRQNLGLLNDILRGGGRLFMMRCSILSDGLQIADCKWRARGNVRGVRLVSFVMMADLWPHIKVMKENKHESKYGVLHDKESLR